MESANVFATFAERLADVARARVQVELNPAGKGR